MIGKTKEHKDYWTYSGETNLSLIRMNINSRESSIKYYNKWLSEYKKNSLERSMYEVKIDELKEDITLLKVIITEYQDLIKPQSINKNKTPKQTYIIKNKRNNLYKIGRSSNPKNREKTLQSEEPLIEIIKTWNEDIEYELHSNYKEYRVRGEWFKLSKTQVRYICTKY